MTKFDMNREDDTKVTNYISIRSKQSLMYLVKPVVFSLLKQPRKALTLIQCQWESTPAQPQPCQDADPILLVKSNQFKAFN